MRYEIWDMRYEVWNCQHLYYVRLFFTEFRAYCSLVHLPYINVKAWVLFERTAHDSGFYWSMPAAWSAILRSDGYFFNTNSSKYMADSGFALSQWEASLQSKTVSHWLGALQHPPEWLLLPPLANPLGPVCPMHQRTVCFFRFRNQPAGIPSFWYRRNFGHSNPVAGSPDEENRKKYLSKLNSLCDMIKSKLSICMPYEWKVKTTD